MSNDSGDVILAGDDGKMYRISRADLGNYEVGEDDPASHHRPALKAALKFAWQGKDSLGSMVGRTAICILP